MTLTRIQLIAVRLEEQQYCSPENATYLLDKIEALELRLRKQDAQIVGLRAANEIHENWRAVFAECPRLQPEITYQLVRTYPTDSLTPPVYNHCLPFEPDPATRFNSRAGEAVPCHMDKHGSPQMGCTVCGIATGCCCTPPEAPKP